MKLVSEGNRIFADVVESDESRLGFRRNLLRVLWDRRDSSASLHDWLRDLRRDIVQDLIQQSRVLADDGAILDSFIARTGPDGDVSDMTLGLFSGFGEGNDRINLSTLHSAKGREFEVVILFGIDDGRIPRRNAQGNELREARRLFYVGFTRAKKELHLTYSASQPSPFVREVNDRLNN